MIRSRGVEATNTGALVLVCAEEDTDCASSTVGMGVVKWSRPLTPREVAECRAFTARFHEALADEPAARREGRENKGDVSDAQRAWEAALPRIAPRD